MHVHSGRSWAGPLSFRLPRCFQSKPLLGYLCSSSANQPHMMSLTWGGAVLNIVLKRAFCYPGNLKWSSHYILSYNK